MSKWPMVKLGEVCEIRIGKTPARKNKDFWGEGLPWLSIKDMNQGRVIRETSEEITVSAVQSLKITPYPPGTVFFSFKLSIGKVGISEIEMFTNEAIAAITPRDSSILLKDYLIEALENAGKRLQGNDAAMGATLNKKSLHEIQISLPPLEEQKRIAGILEASARQLESLRNQIAALEKLRSQVIYEFSTSCSKFISLNEIAEVSTGATPLRKNKSYYEGTIPWVKTGEVVGSEITDTEEHISDLALKETNCRLFRAGTTLVAMYGQGATRGRAGFLSRDMATNQACAAITPIESADDRYVFNLVKASYEKLRASGRGGTQPNLNLKIVKNFEIPYPTDERLRLNLSATCMAVDTQIDALNKKINLLQELHQSLATRAFAGEL